jgi:Zn-dependent M28 family amino/carboxypeptidase
MFIAFGAEEQGVVGSKYYVENPSIPLKKTLCLFNLDGVGRGDSLRVLAAKNYPKIWKFIDRANQKYVHRITTPTKFANLARPRLDAARFLWADVPTISFSSYGLEKFYHITKDNIETITPEIMEDLAQILFLSIVDIANKKNVDFRK